MQDSTSDVQFGEQPVTLQTHRASTSLSIIGLGLRARARNVLIDAGLITVGDVLDALEEGGDKALTGLSGFGPKSLADLKERLRERGYRLPDEAIPLPEPVEVVPEEALELPSAAAAEVTPELEEEATPEEVAPATAEAAAARDEPVTATAREEVLYGTPSFGQRLRSTLAQPGERLGRGPWLYGMIALVVIAALLLPPISLLRRLGLAGYTTLNAENSSISHPDGLTLSVSPDTFTGRLRVRLESVPRLEFLEGSAGAKLRKAVESLPAHLAVKSPLYEIQKRGKSSDPVMIDVVVPNEAEPWETLDLYTWNGEAWAWIGSELHAEVAEHEFIRVEVTDVPDNLVVVQAGLITPTVSTVLEADDNPVQAAAGVLDEVNPTGLLLGTDGGFVGDPTSLPQPGEGYAVIPALRNWAPGATVNRGLLSDLLTMSDVQERHIANIVQLCTENGFAGVEVDYQGVVPKDRVAYSDFIGALAEALHAEGLRLSVAVESPTSTDGGWDTGGYDWAKLGAAADVVQVPFPANPTSYAEGGTAHQLLEWATAQVPRYKLRMLVSSLSAERGEESVSYLPLEQVLASFGKAVALNETTQVEQGSEVAFGFAGRLLSITPQEEVGTYRLKYEAEDGGTRVAWLGTEANLASKLRWASRYHLGGVAVTDMLNPGNAEGIIDAVRGYRANTTALPAEQEMEIVWTVADDATTVDQQVSPLTEPDYSWTAMASPGQYTVNATVGGFDRGSVAVVVAEPEPVVVATEKVTGTEVFTGVAATEALTPTADLAFSLSEGEEEEEEEEGTDDECLGAQYLADVTIPDNTQMEKGEEFVKTWRVRNVGTCDWPEDTVLAKVNSQLGGVESVPVGVVAVGDDVEVSIDLVAPEDDGTYDGSWTLRAGDTDLPGGRLTAIIQIGEGGGVGGGSQPVPAPVSAGGFELGGHVRDMGLPYASQMHYAGMNWAKVQIHYGADANSLVQAAHANNFKIQLSALGSPDMVTQPGFEENFANWVAGLAAAGADAIEVWNEPNIDREWAVGHISAQAYTNLLCASYRAIKAQNPGTAVISAAPSPTGYFGGCSPNGCDDAPWVAGLRDAGAANCMDYLGAHHNAGATSPSASSGHPADQSGHHSWYFLPQTRLYYNTFGGARKLFYTEMGYASQEGVPAFSDWFAWARGTNNAQQAAWLAEAVQLSVNTGMVRCIIVWNIDFGRYDYDPQDGYAIIRPGGGCPACDTLHNVLGTR